ncbi:uncharacterized protein PAC_12015 [Phialocephala subalpina]|uniref:Uncharacterized protein n=1 Tax=Phialocephala subalpina TaxID=576137 RepID=A0A1L7XAQ5_9HELO|nr:uncharacterized protein PAC_12015 [Phialocephala subalpina]
MPSHRTALAAGVILLIFVALYLVRDDFLPGPDNMTTSSSIPIQVSLSSDVSDASIFGSAKLRITLSNTSPHDISLLRWSSPLDNHVPAIGVISFTSSKTGDAAPCLNMKINHRMPTNGYFSADDQSIIHVPAHGKVDEEVVFKEPEVALIKGEEYKAKAQGNWMGVWVHEGGQKDEKLMFGDEMRTGKFESEDIVVNIPNDDEAEL